MFNVILQVVKKIIYICDLYEDGFGFISVRIDVGV